MIKSGDKVYSKHGNVIGEFTRNISSGEPIVSTDFKYCDGSFPDTYSEVQHEILEYVETKMKHPWYKGRDPLKVAE